MNVRITDEEIEAETNRRFRWINSGDPALLDAANAFEAGVRWAEERLA